MIDVPLRGVLVGAVEDWTRLPRSWRELDGLSWVERHGVTPAAVLAAHACSGLDLIVCPWPSSAFVALGQPAPPTAVLALIDRLPADPAAPFAAGALDVVRGDDPLALALAVHRLRAWRRAAPGVARDDVIASVPGVAWVACAETLRFASVGEHAERMLGYPQQRWIDEVDFLERHLHPLDRDRVLETLRREVRQRRAHGLDYRMIAADGRTVWIRDLVQVVADDGQPLRLRGLMIDLGALHPGSATRGADEARLRALFDASTDGILLLSRNGRLLDCNQRFADMLGRELHTMRGLHVWDWSHTRAEHEVRSILRRIDTNGTVLRTVHRRADGSWYVAEITGTAVEWNGEPAILCLCRDVDAQRRAADALRRSEERASVLLDAAIDGVITADARGVVHGWNREAERMFGWTRAEAIGRPLTELVLLAEDRPALVHALQRARTVAGGHLHGRRIERTARCRDGSRLQVEVTVAAIREGADTWFCGFVRDITERQRAERRRQELEAQLRQAQKLEAIGTLAGGIAHDFNNMLAAIQGNVELLADDLGAAPGARSAVEEIQRAVARAASTVRQILTFSREQPMHPARSSPIELVGEVRSLLRAMLPATLSLRTELPETCPSVIVDDSQLQQVLVNLVTNAWHACRDEDAAIVVTVRERALRSPLQLGSARLPAGPYVTFAVQDNGSGIDAAVRERIFEPFFTTKPPERGTGLGLAVVHGIVHGHGGAIEVDSAPGVGSEFTVWLPAAADIARDPSTPRPPAHGAGRRVLFLDDEAPLGVVAVRMLERLGYRARAFQRPTGALEALRQCPDGFDVVVTDHSMPEMDGLQVAAAVRGIRPDLPVVLTSGLLGDDVRRAAAALGIAGVLPKPTRLHDLGRVLERAMRRPAGDGAAQEA
ncbi:MAG: PAS domain S-box protein [Planctomycetota bacterium]